MRVQVIDFVSMYMILVLFWRCVFFFFFFFFFIFFFFFFFFSLILSVRGFRRYQRGNQNPYIEEEQTTQWPKEKVQKDKWRSTKNTHMTKYGVTPTPLKTGDELRCSGNRSSSSSTGGTRRVNLVTNPVISQKWEKGRKYGVKYNS
jgi:hypothetical protein